MSESNPNEARVAVQMTHLFTSLKCLDQSIEVAPDLASLKNCRARLEAHQTMIDFRAWLLRSASNEEDRATVRELVSNVPIEQREDAEVR